MADPAFDDYGLVSICAVEHCDLVWSSLGVPMKIISHPVGWAAEGSNQQGTEQQP